MRPQPCQGASVTTSVCRAVRADIAEPLSAHYNAPSPNREISGAPELGLPVRVGARDLRIGVGTRVAVAYAL